MKLSTFILNHLIDLGVDTIFGVPGDYNLRFLDYIEEEQRLKWVGTCNELNAAYAADGYGKINGLGVLVTTYGVGELSAMNGVAGAYAENVPLIHFVGMPSTSALQTGLPVHHSFGTGYFNEFTEMWTKISCATAQLSQTNWLVEIERVISTAIRKSKPAYIAIPADLFDMEVDDNIHLQFSRGSIGHEEQISQICDLIFENLQKSQMPVAWLGCNTRQFNAVELTSDLIESLNIPFAQTITAKSLYDESSDQYLGLYAGNFSPVDLVKQTFQKADCLIRIGVRITDFNSGGFSHKKFENIIDITDKVIRINGHYFVGVNTHKLLTTVVDKCRRDKIRFDNYLHYNRQTATKNSAPKDLSWSLNHFWDYTVSQIKPNDILLADAGTSFFGIWERNVTVKHLLLTQVLWSSIGYTLPAGLGASCADLSTRALVFIGDGAFQMTAQELSSIARLNLPVIVFLINNDGYTIERAIHGENAEYNDIAPWDYCKFAKALDNRINTHKVKTMEQYQQVLNLIDSNQSKHRTHLIELMFKRDDVPKMLTAAVKGMSKQNS